uniref:Tetraspanin n=1 Tax=Caenorhabditis japonica TaxID=281687 RepID=A0A8R1I0N8_CAEJA
MPLSCTARALKFSLFIFNLVFLLCGLICLGIGLWLVLDKYAIDNLAFATAKVQGYDQDAGLRDLATKPTAVRQFGYLLFGGGLIVIVVAFLGCCGAAKEWRPLLCCYASCLMLILAIQIAATIYAFLHSHMFENDFRDILHSSLKMYNGTDNMKASTSGHDGLLVKTAWDKIMIEKSCCGVDSKLGEFNKSGWYHLNKGRYQFPPACCPSDEHGRLRPYCNTIMRHSHGCYSKIAESFQEVTSHFKIVSWTVVLFALIQVVGIVVGFWLCDSITSDDEF